MAEKLLFATSVEEATAMKDANAAYLAGGTEINRLNTSVDASTLIAVYKIKNLHDVIEEGDILWVGATETFQTVVDHPRLPGWFKEACLMMASRTKRNMATLGGNIALMRDDSYILPALLADNAPLIVNEKGKEGEEYSVAEYLAARKEGKLQDALITWIGIRIDRKIWVKRYANTAMSHSVLNVAYGVDKAGDKVSIGVAAKNCGVFGMPNLAAAIEANPNADEDAVMQLVAASAEKPVFKDDMFGGADYKQYLLGTTLARMVSLSR